MPYIIFEGSSASGKTVLANKVKERLQGDGRSVRVFTEEETFIPILKSQNPEKDLFPKLNAILKEMESRPETYFILDRLHVSGASMANIQMSELSEFESRLSKTKGLLTFLWIDEMVLPERILNARQHRGPSWGKEIESKGGEEETSSWYIRVQRKIRSLYEASTLPKILIDTTSPDYDKICDQLLKELA